jgi:hypothetical protein
LAESDIVNEETRLDNPDQSHRLNNLVSPDRNRLDLPENPDRNRLDHLVNPDENKEEDGESDRQRNVFQVLNLKNKIIVDKKFST